jgi:diguanylate cyclase (GGDEF)-like protein
MYDHLTQAFSRSYFEIRLAEALDRMSPTDPVRLYVCIFDVDNFKTINDRYGHANGDELLKQITRISKETIGYFDCLARLGGDEFVLLLTGIQEDSHAFMMVERIRNSIAETPFGLNSHQFHASCSFGMVSSGADHVAVKDLSNQLLSYADNALYASKLKGKNSISVSFLPEPDQG